MLKIVFMLLNFLEIVFIPQILFLEIVFMALKLLKILFMALKLLSC